MEDRSKVGEGEEKMLIPSTQVPRLMANLACRVLEGLQTGERRRRESQHRKYLAALRRNADEPPLVSQD